MNFYIHTLGCKVNSYESNYIKELLDKEGYNYSDKNIDIYIINTCSVTNNAVKKSILEIKKALKKKAISIVIGCMPTENVEYLKDLYINIILSNKNKVNIIHYINKYLRDRKNIIAIDKYKESDTFDNMFITNFNQTRAYIKIEDGCNNYCSYCIIPYVRGNIKSKDSNIIIKEVTTLLNNNYKEIVLTGIHTGHYGSDINDNLSNLLNKLTILPYDFNIRISSIEITELNNKFLNILNNTKIVNHLHIPIQSGSDNILKAMNRKYDITYYKDKI